MPKWHRHRCSLLVSKQPTKGQSCQCRRPTEGFLLLTKVITLLSLTWLPWRKRSWRTLSSSFQVMTALFPVNWCYRNVLWQNRLYCFRNAHQGAGLAEWGKCLAGSWRSKIFFNTGRPPFLRILLFEIRRYSWDFSSLICQDPSEFLAMSCHISLLPLLETELA